MWCEGVCEREGSAIVCETACGVRVCVGGRGLPLCVRCVVVPIYRDHSIKRDSNCVFCRQVVLM